RVCPGRPATGLLQPIGRPGGWPHPAAWHYRRADGRMKWPSPASDKIRGKPVLHRHQQLLIVCQQSYARKSVMDDTEQSKDLLSLTTEIVAAHVSNNTVALGDLPQLINQIYNSLA